MERAGRMRMPREEKKRVSESYVEPSVDPEGEKRLRIQNQTCYGNLFFSFLSPSLSLILFLLWKSSLATKRAVASVLLLLLY